MLSFKLETNTVYLINGANQKELPRQALLEVYQLVLTHLSPNRDYTSVTSLSKLKRIIDLECEPDESDDEKPQQQPTQKDSDDEEEEEEVPVQKSAPKAPVRGRKPPVKKASPPKKDSDDEEDDD